MLSFLRKGLATGVKRRVIVSSSFFPPNFLEVDFLKENKNLVMLIQSSQIKLSRTHLRLLAPTYLQSLNRQF